MFFDILFFVPAFHFWNVVNPRLTVVDRKYIFLRKLTAVTRGYGFDPLTTKPRITEKMRFIVSSLCEATKSETDTKYWHNLISNQFRKTQLYVRFTYEKAGMTILSWDT